MLKLKLLVLLFLVLALQGQPQPPPSLASSPVALSPAPTEEQLRQTVLPWRDLRTLAVRVKGMAPEEVYPTASPAPPPQRVGDRKAFWVADEANNSYYAVDAVLKVVTPHSYFYLADGTQVDQERLEEAARLFEDRIYTDTRGYFGSEALTGLDGDPRVTILHASIPGLGGYFTSVDAYPRDVQPYSNERKVLYVNVESAPPGSEFYYGVLAHEFGHMIHWNTNRVEQTWVKEGAAEVVTEAVGLESSGSEQAFQVVPDTQLTAWSDPTSRDVLPHYGAAYLFISYFLEHFGGYQSADDLLFGRTRGPETFDHFLSSRGLGLTFEDVFRDWVVANYLDERGAGDPRYRYGRLKLQVPPTERVQSASGWRDRTVQQFGADYLEVNGRWSSARVQFEGEQGNRVISAGAHGGRAFWWSNRGDMVDTRLTRIFDLRGLPAATLNFWTWYDLEDGYDYGYVMISKDGGLTWSTLSTADTTTDNPNGNNLGSGFTGLSDGASRGRWREQSIDLSPYVGDIVLIRFEMVTDDAYNAPGFAVDDISIPELGYSSDAEEGDGGWFANGFVRIDGEISQPFALQLIRLDGGGSTVEQVPVTDGRAEVEIRGADGQEGRAVLVVSGLSRYTTEPARYRFRMETTP